jgi:hypothetical protein
LARARTGAQETTRTVLDTLTAETSAELGHALESVVQEGGTLELPADVLAPCLVLEGTGPTARFRIDRAETCPGLI